MLIFAITNLHDLILEIGSWAGLASVLGLGVLSALYFSQARDVKRLREWAGRAPERSAEQQFGGRPATQAAQAAQAQGARPPGAAPAGATPATPTPATPGTPSPAPAPGVAAAGAAAAAGAGAAAAGAKPGNAGAPAGKPGTAATPAGKPGNAGAPTVPARPATTPAAAQGAPSPSSGGGGTATAAPPRTAPPTVAPPRSLPSTGGQTAILTQPSGRVRELQPWYRRIEPRYIALIVAGVLVLGAGAVYAISQIGGSSSSSGSPQTAGTGAGGGATKPARLDPSKITVAVLNGTRVQGLAAQVGDKVQRGGFQLGNVATARESQRAESIVEFKAGNNRAARAVARRLHISQIEPLDPSSGDQSLAGDAQVLVIVGADQQHGSSSSSSGGGTSSSGSTGSSGAGTGTGTGGTGGTGTGTGTPGAGTGTGTGTGTPGATTP